MMRILQRDKCSAGPANLDRSDVCRIWGGHTFYKDKPDHILMATHLASKNSVQTNVPHNDNGRKGESAVTILTHPHFHCV